jgi:hypothetical protein
MLLLFNNEGRQKLFQDLLEDLNSGWPKEQKKVNLFKFLLFLEPINKYLYTPKFQLCEHKILHLTQKQNPLNYYKLYLQNLLLDQRNLKIF